MPGLKSISSAEARGLALTAQGFTSSSHARSAAGELMDLARRLSAVQIDSVNVLVRSHYLPLYSRLGGYDRDELDALATGRRRKLFEYWGHEASLLPVEMQPLLRWRMERAR